MQLTLLDAPAARRTDPATSHHAAERIGEFAGGQRAAILAVLQDKGPMDPERIGKAVGLDAYSVRKRLPELERAGFAAPTDMTVPTVSGRQQRVWRAV